MKKHLWLLLGFSFLWVGCVPSSPSTINSTHLPTEESQLALEEIILPSPIVTLTLLPEEVTDPELTLTPSPSPTNSDLTPTPSPTIQFPEIWSSFEVNSDYGVAWSVPVDWQEISLAAPSKDAVFWQAWVNTPEKIATQYPIGQMTLMLYVETVASTTIQPEGMEQLTVWGHSVWTQEIEGNKSDSFDLRLSLMKLREPYRYNYRLDCTHSEEADAVEQTTFESLCRYTWDFLFGFFGLCAVPMDQISSASEWQAVSDEENQYFFLIPAGWLIRQGPTPDRLNLLSDPTAESQPNICPLPNGIMSLDFAADRPGNFGTGEPGSGPNTEGFTEMTVASRPAWLQTVEDEELMGPFVIATMVYIQGPEFWYTLMYSCTPPTDTDSESQSNFKAQCEDVLDQILDSFQFVEP